jgi:acyl-CoA oxidase
VGQWLSVNKLSRIVPTQPNHSFDRLSASMTIPWMKNATNIGLRYSLRRKIGPPEQLTSIFNFRTQQLPIITSLARSSIMEPFSDWAIETFLDPNVDFRVRHGLAAILKATGVQHSQEANLGISERCGAQGLFEHNMFVNMHGDGRGCAIAEVSSFILFRISY